MKLFTLVKALFLVASISFSHRILWAVNSQANSILLDQKGNVVIGGFANNESTNRTDFLCARYLPDGILDTTFNANGPNPGIVQISPALIKLPESTDLGITGLALDKQGRIVVLGYVDTDGIGSSMMVLRLHPDGTLDTTFNPSGSFGPIPGVVLITHSAFGEVGTAVAIDSQGRIIGVGTTDDGQNLGIVVFRLLPDGTTDTSFNSQKTLPGRFTFSRSNSDTVAQAVALHADDSIMIAGYLTVSFQSDFLLIKLTPQGDLDRTFNVQSQTPGIIVQDITGFDNRAYALKIDSQGRSLIGGYTSNENGSEFFALARYTASGELDTSFNAAGIGTGIPGIVSTDVTESAIVGTASVIRSLAVTQTDAIVVAGYVLNEIGQSFATARYTSEGLLDTTYNSSGSLPGIVIQTIYPQENLRGFGQSDSTNQFNAVVIGSQNELYGAGYAFDGLQNNCSVLSYSAHGQLNSVFNTEGLISGKPGIVITQVGNPLTALGNGSTYPTEQDSSQVNPEILTDLQNPPKPQLPRIHTQLLSYNSKEEKLIRGTAGPMALVTLFVDGKALGKTLADTEGLWVLRVPPLIEGNHELQIVSLNVISGLMVSSDLITIFAKPQQIMPPVIETPRNNEKVGPDSVTIRGRSEPGYLVNLVIDGKRVTIHSDARGEWSYKPHLLNEGIHEVYASLEVPNKQRSPSSKKIRFNCVGDAKAPRIVFPRSGYETTGHFILLKGEGMAQTELEILKDRAVVGKTTVGSDGLWSYRLPFVPGPATVSVASKKNNLSSERVTVTVKKEEFAPSLPPNKKGTITGIASPGSEISLYSGNKPIGITRADQFGRWAHTPSSAMPRQGTQPVIVAEMVNQGTSRMITGSPLGT